MPFLQKRKARLLSEHMDDLGFQVSVPYSLNRKNRWNTVNLDECLLSAVGTGNVKLSGAEAYLTLNGPYGHTGKKYKKTTFYEFYRFAYN